MSQILIEEEKLNNASLWKFLKKQQQHKCHGNPIKDRIIRPNYHSHWPNVFFPTKEHEHKPNQTNKQTNKQNKIKPNKTKRQKIK